jgi:hypothetical protein
MEKVQKDVEAKITVTRGTGYSKKCRECRLMDLGCKSKLSEGLVHHRAIFMNEYLPVDITQSNLFLPSRHGRCLDIGFEYVCLDLCFPRVQARRLLFQFAPRRPTGKWPLHHYTIIY